jgi:hypothetical protein
MVVPTKSLQHIERRPTPRQRSRAYSVALFVSEIRSFWRDAVTFELEVAEATALGRYFLRLFGWQNLLDIDLTNEVFAF